MSFNCGFSQNYRHRLSAMKNGKHEHRPEEALPVELCFIQLIVLFQDSSMHLGFVFICAKI